MSDVRVITLGDLGEADLERLLWRRGPSDAGVDECVRQIIEAVRVRGDEALVEFTEAYDGVRMAPSAMRVGYDDIAAAGDGVQPVLKDALDAAMRNIERFHAGQVQAGERWVEVEPGVWCGERCGPIDSVCLYVPRGRGSFASVACMLAVPAKIAGCGRRVVCTPPGPDGSVDAATLYVCGQTGVDEVYGVGGAQAVAAVAYGTQRIARCDKFVGPGNVYVSAARRLLADVIDPGPPAGPSESLIIADGSADAADAAWNLLIEAEHGENSTAFLVTESADLAADCGRVVGELMGQLDERRRGFVQTVLSERGGIVVADSMDACIDLANRMAPEHLAMMVADPWAVHPRIRNAGEILFGGYPVISLGNYAMGVNAILPTGGRAASASSVGVMDFMTRTELGFVTAEGFRSLKGRVSVLSRDEGFCAHHLAVERWSAGGAVREGT